MESALFFQREPSLGCLSEAAPALLVDSLLPFNGPIVVLHPPNLEFSIFSSSTQIVLVFCAICGTSLRLFFLRVRAPSKNANNWPRITASLLALGPTWVPPMLFQNLASSVFSPFYPIDRVTSFPPTILRDF